MIVHKLRIYRSERCGYEFKKYSASIIQKCPKCKEAVFDRNYRPGEPLDDYSRTKLRWYSDPTGARHQEEIRMRSLENGKTVIRDKKGLKVDEMPEISI